MASEQRWRSDPAQVATTTIGSKLLFSPLNSEPGFKQPTETLQMDRDCCLSISRFRARDSESDTHELLNAVLTQLGLKPVAISVQLLEGVSQPELLCASARIAFSDHIAASQAFESLRNETFFSQGVVSKCRLTEITVRIVSRVGECGYL
jgi:hypothetical protein